MARSDYRQPASYQITKHYTCQSCGNEFELESTYSPAMCCGRYPQETGESYPADSSEWDLERDDVNDDFRDRR